MRIRPEGAVRVVSVCAAAVVALGLTGCSLLEPASDDAQRGGDGHIVKAGDLSAFALRTGDCLDQGRDNEVATVTAVPCGQVHDAEVYADFDLPDGPFPGDPSVASMASAQCDADFSEFVGVPSAQSKLEFYPLVPTIRSWTQKGDRSVSCVAFIPDTPVSGTLRNARR